MFLIKILILSLSNATVKALEATAREVEQETKNSN